MAQIPIRRADWQAQGVPLVATPVVDGIGRGLQAIGQNMGQMAAVADDLARREEQLAVTDAWAQARLALHQDMAELLQSAPDDGAGIGQALRDRAASRQAEVLASLPSKRARQMIAPHLIADAGEMGIRADAEELKLRQGAATRKIGSIADTMGAMVRLDPGKLDHAASVLDEAISVAPIPEAARAALREQYRHELPKYTILGEVDRDPAAALERLQAGQWNGRAAPAIIHTGIEQAQAELRRRDAEQRSALAKRKHAVTAEIENQVRLGWDDPAARRPLPPDFDLVLGPDQAREGRLQIDYAQKLGGLAKAGLWTSPQKLLNDVNALKPNPADDDYALRSKAWANAKDMMGRMIAARVQNPGQYLEQDPIIATAWQSGRYEEAISGAKRLAQEAGFAPNASVISPERASEIATRIMTAPPDQMGATLDLTAKAAGAHWSDLQSALLTSGKLDKSMLALTIVNNPTIRADLASAIQFERVAGAGKLKESAQATAGDELKKAEAALMEKIGPFTAALRVMGGRDVDQRIVGIEEAARLRLYDLVKRDAALGRSGLFDRPNRATANGLASIIASEIVGSEYYISSRYPSMIIPRSIMRQFKGESDTEANVDILLRPKQLQAAGAYGQAEVDYAEAIIRREDAKGAARRQLDINVPPSGDGATAEIAGITKEHHPVEFARLSAMDPADRYTAAAQYIREWTKPVAEKGSDPATRTLLADIAHHRGLTGAADIARLALGQDRTGKPWSDDLTSGLRKMPQDARLLALTNAREAYEVQKIGMTGERAKFAAGLRSRWQSAYRDARTVAYEQAFTDTHHQFDVVTAPDMTGIIVGRTDKNGHFVPMRGADGKAFQYKWSDIASIGTVKDYNLDWID